MKKTVVLLLSLSLLTGCMGNKLMKAPKWRYSVSSKIDREGGGYQSTVIQQRYASDCSSL